MNLDKLIPKGKNNDNSIIEVVASIILVQPIIKIERIKDLIHEDIFKKNFQDFRLVGLIEDDINIDNQQNINSLKKQEIIGIEFFSFENGLKTVLRCENKRNTSVIALHSLSYSSWKEFKNLFFELLSVLKKIIGQSFVNKIILTYVDSFDYQSNKPVPIEHIFNINNSVVPFGLIKDENKNLNNWNFSIKLTYEQPYKYQDSIQVYLKNNENLQELRLIHDCLLNLKDEIEFSKFIENQEQFEKEFEWLHIHNRDILRKMFSNEVLSKIKLPNHDN
jgi:uncharacterized protein (TIGR04255 family)